jgi:hypothetical protein
MCGELGIIQENPSWNVLKQQAYIAFIIIQILFHETVSNAYFM